jgi:hypothetical protein
MKLLIGELQPNLGQVNRNGRLRVACEDDLSRVV